MSADSKSRRARNKQIKAKKYSIKRSMYIVILMILVSMYAVTMSISLAKYSRTFASNDLARVANLVANLNVEDEDDITFLPDSTRIVEFNVNNFEGEINLPTKINEVGLNYRIRINIAQVIQNLSRIPITTTLYEVDVVNGVEQTTIVNITNGMSDWMELTQATAISKKYRLVFTWPRSEGNSYIYANLEEELTILLEVEQKDVI